MAAEPTRPGIPPESENFRQTGARKLEARPEADYHEESRFEGDPSGEKSRRTHLMGPVVKAETHQYDGVNPPGTSSYEGELQDGVPVEGDVASASPDQGKNSP